MTDVPQHGYSDNEQDALGQLWGDGFLSPGGPAEIARIIAPYGVEGLDVLDVGCGRGTIAVLLAQRHGARHVTGIDLQPDMIANGVQRAAEAGVADRVSFELVSPGPLPFVDATFDVAFSKDAIVHVADKRALYADMYRVLRPGGRLMVGDWLGGGDVDPARVADFHEVSEGQFTLISLHDLAALVAELGFVEVETDDRRDWYLAEATAELQRLREDEHEAFVDRFGAEEINGLIEFWEGLVVAVESGVLRPGHIRARRPAD